MMMSCVARWMQFTWMFLIAWAATETLVFSQTPDSSASTPITQSNAPYRRVFVPESAVEGMDLEGYRLMEWKRLEELIKAYQRLQQNSSQTKLPDQSPIQLTSSYYVARLDGADLLSDRSQLTLSRPSWIGERVSLQPWSIAVHTPNSNPTSFDVIQSGRNGSTVGSWIFDEQGAPLVPAIPPSAASPSTFSDSSNQVKHWFGWSARAASSSTPNKLQFAFSVPKCADSCLVLVLPPQAEVTECSTVARRMERWSQVTERVGNWAENANESLGLQGPNRALDSIWMIELGGSQRAAFSISIGTNNRRQNAIDDREGHRYLHLIRTQRNEHRIEDHIIRSRCDAEIQISAIQPLPLRLSLPDGTRLSRLLVNQQEVDWQVVDGWIQWNPKTASDTKLASESALSAPIIATVSAELMTPLVTEKTGLSLPLIAFDRSYVMTGSTSIETVAPWRLTQLDTEAAKTVDTNNASSKPNTNRLGFAWHGSPKPIQVRLEQITTQRQCELLTRLTNDAQEMEASVRARLFFTEQDSSRATIAIASGWQIRSIASSNPADTPKISPELGSSDNGTYALEWSNVQQSRIAEIELQLFRPMDSSSNSTRQLDASPLVQMQGWKQQDTFAIEDTDSFHWSVQEEFVEHLISEAIVSEWQKDFIAKNTNLYLLRIVAPQDNASPRPLTLTWSGKPSVQSVHIRTDVAMLTEQSLVARHEMKLSLSSNRSEGLTIETPNTAILWQIQDGDQWKTLFPQGQEAGAVKRYELEGLPNQCTLLATVSVPIDPGSSVAIEPFNISNATTETRSARSLSPRVQIQFQGENTWAVDAQGQTLLMPADPSSDSKLIVRSLVSSSPPPSWIGLHSDLDLAVDSAGTQSALLRVRSEAQATTPLSIELDDGWEPMEVTCVQGRSKKSIPFRRDGRRVVVAQGQTSNSDTLSDSAPVGFEVQIRLNGPTLSKKFLWSRQRQVFDLKWPALITNGVRIDRDDNLWLPRDLEVVGSPWDLNTASHEAWPMWMWYRQAMQTIAGGTKDSTQGAANALQHGHVLESMLIPKLLAEDWHAVALPSNAFWNTSYSLSPMLEIGERDAYRSLTAVLFATCMVLTPKLIRIHRGMALVIFIAMAIAAHLAPMPIATLAGASFVGMGFGFCVLVIYQVFREWKSDESRAIARQSSRWVPWNERTDASLSDSNHALGIAPNRIKNISVSSIGWGICFGLAHATLGIVGSSSMSARAQEPDTSIADSVFQVIIPMDDSGNLAGNSVYVPEGFITALNEATDRNSIIERGTYPISARHVLRIAPRGRVINSSDQVIMAYEFMVGSDLSEVRFPINNELLQLVRLSVDESEVNLGSKLRRTSQEWIWKPDKPGRRVVQIVAQPIFKSVESDKSKDTPAQQLDLPILPVANASISIEAEAQSSLEILSLGRVIDPAAGRYFAMLGAVERLQCTVSLKAPKSMPNLGIGSTATADGGESAVMHTELFLQNDLLQAKTIMDYPKGVAIGREVEIEADQLWLPVGTQWGDAQWIDVRPGSTLSRRRYVLEWIDQDKNNGSVTPSNRDRQISVVWIPQTNGQSLNVLFAECDRRTRLGTLRYARAPGSLWSIEGINTWVPAISSKDRLDWPELKQNPLATPLRIPANGGFGILKPRVLTEHPQARISTKWIVEPRRESLTSRIELVDSGSSLESLVLELPKSFVATDVYNREGSLRYLQNQTGDRSRVQVITDRKILESGDIWVQAKKQVDLPESDPEPWSELPWVVLPPSIHTDQNLEIAASEQVAIRLESQPEALPGKGIAQSIANLSKSSVDFDPGDTLGWRFQKLVRSKPVEGELLLTWNGNVGTPEIDLQARLKGSVMSKPAFVLEVPLALKERWQSELRIQSIPCPNPTKAWLQVFLPNSGRVSPNNSTLSARIQFQLSADQSISPYEWMAGIRSINFDSLPTYYAIAGNGASSQASWTPVDTETKNRILQAFATDFSLQVFAPHRWPAHAVNTPQAAGEAVGAAVVKDTIHSVSPLEKQNEPSEVSVLLESRYWVDAANSDAGYSGKLRWFIPEGVKPMQIQVNGISHPIQFDGEELQCWLGPTSLCSEVVLYSKCIVASENQDRVIRAPVLSSHPSSDERFLASDASLQVSIGGKVVRNSLSPESQQRLAESAIELLQTSLNRIPNSLTAEKGSDVFRWNKYWCQLVAQRLYAWSVCEEIEPMAYARSMQGWHDAFQETKKHFPSLSIAENWNDVQENMPSPQGSHQPSASQLTKWYSLAGVLMTLASVFWMATSMQVPLLHRPWWVMLAIGFLVWLISGSWLPALILGSCGLIVAADYYWMVSERLRRIGTPGLRSP